MATNSSKPTTMAELLASQSFKPISYRRGDKVLGTVVAINDNDFITDLGAKSEGIINRKDFDESELSQIKVGSKLSAFVVLAENESGLIILSKFPVSARVPSGRFAKKEMDSSRQWAKFTAAMENKTKLTGRVVELNKGGLLVEVDGVRGFLPISQIGFETLKETGGLSDLSQLIDKELPVLVIEVDSSGNRLIFSGRTKVSDDVRQKLRDFSKGQKVTGKIVAVLSFGLMVDVDGVEGLIQARELSWERVEDLAKEFRVGESIEALITEVDENSGKLGLSVRSLSKDPFEKLAEKFQPDDVVKGTVKEVISAGLVIDLGDGVEGFIQQSSTEAGTAYTVGQPISALVDSVDRNRRRVNLVPFVTSTKDLFYK